MTVSVLTAFWAARHVLELSSVAATSVSFLAIAFAQLVHVLNMRAPDSRLLRNEVTTNRWVWGALILCVLLLAAATLLRMSELRSMFDLIVRRKGTVAEMATA